MSEIDPAFEKKILKQVVEQMEDAETTMKKQIRVKKAMLGLGSLGMIIVFILAMHDLLDALSIALISAVSGIFIGYGLLLDFLQKQWPVTRTHINMQSVRERLNELEKNVSEEKNNS